MGSLSIGADENRCQGPEQQANHIPGVWRKVGPHMIEQNSGTALCDLYVELVPVSGASITVFRHPGAQSTICASDGVAAALDQLQFDLGEGPRWETARTGLASASLDVRLDLHPEWPVFGAAAAKLGVGALFSFPISMGTQLFGVADLYRELPGPLDDEATARAKNVSRQVAAPAAQFARRSASSPEQEAGEAAAIRREVHQATGMILMQLETDAPSALAALRGYAFGRGRSVEDVARDVVARRIDFGQEGRLR